MSKIIKIDGSLGEGVSFSYLILKYNRHPHSNIIIYIIYIYLYHQGGQVLRIALSLSALCKIPIEIENIRAGRPKPGLAAQHLKGNIH